MNFAYRLCITAVYQPPKNMEHVESDLLPNYYAVLNVSYHASPQDMPPAFYSLTKDPKTYEGYKHMVSTSLSWLFAPNTLDMTTHVNAKFGRSTTRTNALAARSTAMHTMLSTSMRRVGTPSPYGLPIETSAGSSKRICCGKRGRSKGKTPRLKSERSHPPMSTMPTMLAMPSWGWGWGWE